MCTESERITVDLMAEASSERASEIATLKAQNVKLLEALKKADHAMSIARPRHPTDPSWDEARCFVGDAIDLFEKMTSG